MPIKIEYFGILITLFNLLKVSLFVKLERANNFNYVLFHNLRNENYY